jgi:hypothetical protein
MTQERNRSAVEDRLGIWIRKGLFLTGMGLCAALAVAAFMVVMVSYDHNEGLYVTAGWLVAHGRRLYEDFSFWQMPYSAWLYAGVFWLVPSSHFLLMAKGVAFLFWVGSAATLFAIVRHLARDALIGVALTVLFACNLTIVRCAAEASNYIQPLAFALAAFLGALHGSTGDKGRFWGWAAAGGCIAAATGLKLYYLPCALVFALVAILFPRGQAAGSRLRQGLVPFLAGMGFGLLPVAVVAVRNPAAFFFNNLRVHAVTAGWWHDVIAQNLGGSSHFGIPLTYLAKATYARKILELGCNASLIIGVVGCLGLLVRRGAMKIILSPEHVLASGLTVVAVAMTFIPTPMWLQYWGMPVEFLFLWFAVLVVHVIRATTAGGMIILAAVIGVSLASGAVGFAWEFRRVGVTKDWSGLSLHRLAVHMGDVVQPSAGKGERLASLNQVFAVESGRFDVCEELAYAPFTYVIADRLTPAERRKYHLAGPRELEQLFGSNQPGAVYASVNPENVWSETAMLNWGETHGYQEAEGDFGLGAKLLVPGAGSGARAPSLRTARGSRPPAR